jgi:mannose-6-phosphate isomerase-like protein (cupin superfamily)
MALMSVCACAQTPQARGILSANERAQAAERGRTFQPSVKGHALRPMAYKLELLTQLESPRIHHEFDVSLFVLSGRVRVLLADEAHELGVGDSVDVRSGAWYATESLNEDGSSVFFAFMEPESATAKRVAAPYARTP